MCLKRNISQTESPGRDHTQSDQSREDVLDYSYPRIISKVVPTAETVNSDIVTEYSELMKPAQNATTPGEQTYQKLNTHSMEYENIYHTQSDQSREDALDYSYPRIISKVVPTAETVNSDIVTEYSELMKPAQNATTLRRANLSEAKHSLNGV